jgi:hypothetical protein
VVAALLGAALLVVSGSTGALAAPSAASEGVEAAQRQAQRLAPELTELAGQVRDALAGLEGKAAALAEETPTVGQPGCELDEPARQAALDRLRTAIDEVGANFEAASADAVGDLRRGADRFAVDLKAAGSAAEVTAAFDALDAALGAAADKGGVTVEEVSAGVKAARDTALNDLDAACAPEAQIDEVSDEADAVVGLLAQVNDLLDETLPVALGQLDEARQAVLAGVAAGGEDEGQGAAEDDANGDVGGEDQATTTTAAASEDDDALPRTGAALLPLLVFGLVVAGVGAMLVAASRRRAGV